MNHGIWPDTRVRKCKFAFKYLFSFYRVNSSKVYTNCSKTTKKGDVQYGITQQLNIRYESSFLHNLYILTNKHNSHFIFSSLFNLILLTDTVVDSEAHINTC